MWNIAILIFVQEQHSQNYSWQFVFSCFQHVVSDKSIIFSSRIFRFFRTLWIRSRFVWSDDRMDRDFNTEKITIFSLDRLWTICHLDQEEWSIEWKQATREQETWSSFCSISFYDSFPRMFFRIVSKQEHQCSIKGLSMKIDLFVESLAFENVKVNGRC